MREIYLRGGGSRGGGERPSQPTADICRPGLYRLPLETSNDIPLVAVAESRRSRERERGKFAFFLSLLPLRPPTPVQAKFEGRGVRGVMP